MLAEEQAEAARLATEAARREKQLKDRRAMAAFQQEQVCGCSTY